MKIRSYLTNTTMPYILVTVLTIFIFLLDFCNIPFVSKKCGIIVFIILFITALIRDLNYKNWLLKLDEGKIKEYIRRGMYIERHNIGLGGAIETTKELFDVAISEILMQAGNLDHEFYENEVISNAIKSFLENKGKVRIICSPKQECDPETKTIFEFQNKQDYNIKILHSEKRPDLHFMVIDDKHYRIEKKHPPGKYYKANIIYNIHFFADFHKYIFIKNWREIENNEFS